MNASAKKKTFAESRCGFIFRFAAVFFFLMLADFTTSEAAQSDGASAAESAPLENEFGQSLVGRLGDPDPEERRIAESELLKFGSGAMQALRQGLRSTNPEIHDRCAILIGRLREENLKRRADDFLKLTSESPELNQYETWPAFEEMVGGDSLAKRRLFLRMCESFPDTFEDFGFKFSAKPETLKQHARRLLAPGSYVSRSILLTGYLFLASEADRIAGPSKGVFDKVELLEAVSFMADPASMDSLQKSEHRETIDRLIVFWIARQQRRDSGLDDSVEEGVWRLAYESGSTRIMGLIAPRYQTFSARKKLKFIDIVAGASPAGRVADAKADLIERIRLLGLAISDRSFVMKTRLRERPVEVVDVFVGDLAHGAAANLINRTREKENDKFKTDALFGGYPFSAKPLSVLSQGEDKEKIENWIEASMKTAAGSADLISEKIEN
jgi:hypothetical protein